MSGLTASLLLPHPVRSAKVVALLRENFHPMTDNVLPQLDFAFDGSIEERPFVIDCGWENKREIENMNFEAFIVTFGFCPVDTINVVAMCRDPCDHQLLARICAVLATQYSAILDFHGKPHTIDRAVNSLPGRYITIPCAEDSESTVDEYYADAPFVAAWSRHPDCRMVR